MVPLIKLENRGILAIHGNDARSFLQGIVTCDVEIVSRETIIYGAFLTPQGKFLFDFFMGEHGDGLFLETEASRIPDFIKRLSLYKLRADVKLIDASADYNIYAVLDNGQSKPPFIYADPRLNEAGSRAIVPMDDVEAFENDPNYTLTDFQVYEQRRMELGLPDSASDLIVDKSTLLENGFDELNGVNWNKGCYMGQEVTARMKHRGLIKKRLVSVHIEGPPPTPGTKLIYEDREAGEMRSSSGSNGLALIKLDFMDKQLHPELSSETTISARKPYWVNF